MERMDNGVLRQDAVASFAHGHSSGRFVSGDVGANADSFPRKTTLSQPRLSVGRGVDARSTLAPRIRRLLATCLCRRDAAVKSRSSTCCLGGTQNLDASTESFFGLARTPSFTNDKAAASPVASRNPVGLAHDGHLGRVRQSPPAVPSTQRNVGTSVRAWLAAPFFARGQSGGPVLIALRPRWWRPSLLLQAALLPTCYLPQQISFISSLNINTPHQ